MKKTPLISTISLIMLLCVSGCGVLASPKASAQPISTVFLTPADPLFSDTGVSFNPIYDFYTTYDSFTSTKLGEYRSTLAASDSISDIKKLMKLSSHLAATTLAMNTAGKLISSDQEDYYGDLFDGFAGTGEIIKYPDRYEFTFTFDAGGMLWGTLKDDKIKFYKGITADVSSASQEITVERTNAGYRSVLMTTGKTSTLTINMDELDFKVI